MLPVFPLVPSTQLLRLAHLLMELFWWSLHVIGLLLKMFAAVEVCFAAALMVVVVVYRAGRLQPRSRQPILSPKSTA